MKIFTITCHDVYNHGASLQAYALMKHLMKCGHDVKIIDYKPDYLSNHYNLLSINNHKWEKNILTKIIYLSFKVPNRLAELKRKKAFDKFTKEHLSLTPLRYGSNDELKKNVPEADVYICGSDQIWNSLHMNGKDPAFYLDFVPDDKIKASYAASFATETISEKYRTLVKEKVGKLDRVAVREKSGVDILERLDISESVNVVDPVFLLDQKDWNTLATKEYKNEQYILVYDFDNSHLIKEIATRIAEQKGYKIYTINQSKLKYADKYFIFEGPETFVSLIRDARMIISNSYHAAVFSIIYEKDFLILNRNEAINTRMRDLLDDLNLNERIISENYNFNELLERIDYLNPMNLLNKKITFSKDYINDVLSLSKEKGGLNSNEENTVCY